MSLRSLILAPAMGRADSLTKGLKGWAAKQFSLPNPFPWVFEF